MKTIVIPCVGRAFTHEIDKENQLKDMQAVVDGLIQPVCLGAMDIYVNEDGLPLSLPPNALTTTLVQSIALDLNKEDKPWSPDRITQFFAGDAILVQCSEDENYLGLEVSQSLVSGYITGSQNLDKCDVCQEREPVCDIGDNGKRWAALCEYCFNRHWNTVFIKLMESANDKNLAEAERQFNMLPRFGTGHGQILMDEEEWSKLA